MNSILEYANKTKTQHTIKAYSSSFPPISSLLSNFQLLLLDSHRSSERERERGYSRNYLEMSQMGTKSDFAQKLLQDLRTRKEKMGVTQSSSQTYRGGQSNMGRTSRSSRQMNTLESSGSTIGNTSRRSNTGSSRSIQNKESSNQIVLYESTQTVKQVRDLSMAIAFAFENSGNLTKITTSSSNPLVNFFNRISRRSTESHGRTFTNPQFPNISQVHINEISKGVQKLNQILKACSNGLNFDRNSVEVGRELLKGAMNLEESLKMLVSLQESSNMSRNQKKGRIKLLEEGEDDQDDSEDIAQQWKLDRPRFSFDKPSRSSNIGNRRQQQLALTYSEECSKMVTHTRSSSSVQDLSFSTKEKGRISNVIAQLMGLEELPAQEYSVSMQNGSKGKEAKLSRRNTKVAEPMGRESRNGSSFITDKKTVLPPPVKDSKVQLSTKQGIATKNRQQSVAVAPNQVAGHQRVEDSVRKQNLTGTKESKMLVLSTELQQKAQNSKNMKDEGKMHYGNDYKVKENSTDKRKADKDLTNYQRALLQDKVRRAELKNQHFQKQNLMHKNHEGDRLESVVDPKSKKSTATMQKKPSQDKSAPGNGRSTKSTEKVPMKVPIDSSQKTEPSQEIFKKEDSNHDSSLTKPQFDVEKGSGDMVIENGKQTEAFTMQKKAIPRKIQKSETPQKIEVLMNRRKVTEDRLARSMKLMHKKSTSLRRKEEKSNSKIKENKTGLSMSDATEMSTEPEKKQDKLQNEADESQIEDIQSMPILDDSCDNIALDSAKVCNDFQMVEQPDALNDEAKQCDQSIGENEEKTDPYNLSQNKYKQPPAFHKQERLTEPEKNLKEVLIKSQQFLSTAEALFKLNIPVSFLHYGDEVTEKKLVLDSAYEVMKRKARRHEVTHHPFTKTAINSIKLRSLDDLVRQICKDLEMLKVYGGNGVDVAAGLHEMLNKDIYDKEPDVNSMWDFEWSKMRHIVPEKEDLVRDVERHMINGLLDEITNDLLLITVSV